jgi:hypothetical protein
MELSKLTKQHLISKDHASLNIVKKETNFFLIMRDTKSKSKYDLFDSSINVYLSKIPSSPCKDAVSGLMKRNKILIATSADQSKDGLLGGIGMDTSNALKIIALDSADLKINVNTGECNNPDELIYISYFLFIRFLVLSNITKINTNKKLIDSIISYYTFLMLKLIGKSSYLNDDQVERLRVLVKFFYYRFQLGKSFDESVSKIETTQDVDDFLKVASKYKNCSNIFPALLDFRIVSINPQKLVMDAIQLLKLHGYYSLTSSADYLFAMAVISKYPTEFFKAALVNNALSSDIEKMLIDTYGRTVTYKDL